MHWKEEEEAVYEHLKVLKTDYVCSLAIHMRCKVQAA